MRIFADNELECTISLLRVKRCARRDMLLIFFFNLMPHIDKEIKNLCKDQKKGNVAQKSRVFDGTGSPCVIQFYRLTCFKQKFWQ